MARPPASLRALAVARGDEPADILLKGGHVLSPVTREWVRTDLAIADGVIAGWGHREAKEIIDVTGCWLTPGFVDAHMHLESSKMWVSEYVRAVLPMGTTAVAADPHEIANVAGVEGIAALIDSAEKLPFTFGVAALFIASTAAESADVASRTRRGALIAPPDPTDCSASVTAGRPRPSRRRHPSSPSAA